MTDQEPTCPACGVPFANHLGLQGTCEKLQRYRIALADAIRRPMGFIPKSADGLITDEDIRAAEQRRKEMISFNDKRMSEAAKFLPAANKP